jgi:hypothetical protein
MKNRGSTIMKECTNYQAFFLKATPPRNQITVRLFQNFAIYILNNGEVEVAVVPELGAKIISLRNLRTGREWLWHPVGGLKLFKNQIGDDFFTSPLVGIDECLPTITPCSWQGRQIPDHGEVWRVPWQVDAEALRSGTLKSSVTLKVSPFKLIRTIELRGNVVHLRYELINRSLKEESFIWAIHPLLRLEDGDQLELPDSTHKLLNDIIWISAIGSAIPENKCAKTFARPICRGLAAVRNEINGDRLEFEWDSVENNTLGLWLTRGGWHGHHHFAIEPTNADEDVLALAAERKRCGIVAAADSVTWQIRLRVGLNKIPPNEH